MNRLKELIDRYGNLKSEIDSYKKQVDEDNAEIKRIMLESNCEKETGTDYKATCKIITTESFNDAKLLAKLKSIWSETHGSMTNPFIKRIEVVDMEEVEKAIYSGEIDPKDLADCKDIKTQTRLTVSKIKK